MIKFLRKILDANAHRFENNGVLEKLYPLYEATDTILFSTDEVTKSGPHIRDSIDIKRVMILVVIALIPLYIFGAWGHPTLTRAWNCSCWIQYYSE